MGDVREKAAKAAREWLDDNPGLSDERAIARGITGSSRYGFEVGYTDGHAAGVEEGARRALGWAFDNSFLSLHDWEKEGEEITFDELLARFLSSLAPGTGLETGEGQKEKEKP